MALGRSMTKEERNEKIAQFSEALDIDMFEGDFGDQGDTCLVNKLVIAKKDHIGGCSECGGDCLKGSVNRVMKWSFSQARFMSYRYCESCMNEMMKELTEDEDCEEEEKEDV